jgi:prepilin-type N-terminal cleavage/methylation domain-containing protein
LDKKILNSIGFTSTPIYIMMKKIKAEEKQIRHPISSLLVIRKLVRGFTLIELLVVMSIMSMLMSIMLPALNRSRQSGSRVVCMSNLRQLSLAWYFFSNDYDGQLISPSGMWNIDADNYSWVCDGLTIANPLNNTEAAIKSGALWPYLQDAKVYQCPGQSEEFPRSFELSWTMGGSDWPAGTHCFKNYAQITSPSKKLLFICNIHTFRLGEYRYTYFWPFGDSIDPVRWHDVSNPGVAEMRQSHLGGTNISYADMHVDKWKWQDPRTLQWVNWEMSSEEASPNNIDLRNLAEMMNVEWKQ